MKNILFLLVFFIFGFAPLQSAAQGDENLVGFVVGDSPINLRRSPNGAIVSTIPPNMSVAILGKNEDGEWLLVELVDGQMGWVSADLLRVIESDIPMDLMPIDAENTTRLEALSQVTAIVTTRMAFSPDGRLIAAISSDGAIHVYDVRTKILITTLRVENAGISDLAFRPDGGELAGSAAGAVHFWNTQTWGERTRFEGHRDEVIKIAYSPNGEQVVSAGRDDTLIIWDARTGERIHVMDLDTYYVTDMAFSPDGTKLATAGDYVTSVVRLWDATTGEELWERSFGGNLHFVFDPDGNLVLLNDSHTLVIQGLSAEQGLQTFSILSTAINGGSSLSIHPAGRLVAAGAGNHAGFLVADLESHDVLFSDDSASEFPNTDLKLVFSPDGRLLATSDNLHGIFLWGVRWE